MFPLFSQTFTMLLAHILIELCVLLCKCYNNSHFDIVLATLLLITSCVRRNLVHRIVKRRRVDFVVVNARPFSAEESPCFPFPYNLPTLRQQTTSVTFQPLPVYIIVQ